MVSFHFYRNRAIKITITKGQRDRRKNVAGSGDDKRSGKGVARVRLLIVKDVSTNSEFPRSLSRASIADTSLNNKRDLCFTQ